MALDTTVAGTTADSYCTVAEADAYHAARGYSADWAAAPVDQKELFLKWAARELDSRFVFIGTRSTRDQTLMWPRYGAFDRDGYPYDWNVVPPRLKNAQAEYAFQLMKEDWTQGLESITDAGVAIGPLRTTTERHSAVPASVSALISPLVSGGAGAVRALEMVNG